MMRAAVGAGSGAAILAASAAVLIWGGTPIATRIAVESIDPAMVGMLRTLLAALLAPFLLLALRVPRPNGANTRPLLAFAGLCAFVGFPVLFSIGITAASWSAVAYLAFAVSSLGYLLWYWALAKGGVARIGTLQFMQPVASLVLAVLLLSEPITLPLAACAALVLAGTILAHRG